MILSASPRWPLLFLTIQVRSAPNCDMAQRGIIPVVKALGHVQQALVLASSLGGVTESRASPQNLARARGFTNNLVRTQSAPELVATQSASTRTRPLSGCRLHRRIPRVPLRRARAVAGLWPAGTGLHLLFPSGTQSWTERPLPCRHTQVLPAHPPTIFRHRPWQLGRPRHAGDLSIDIFLPLGWSERSLGPRLKSSESPSSPHAQETRASGPSGGASLPPA